MPLGIGDIWPIVEMNIMVYSGTDPEMIAICEAFNAFFSLGFTLGAMSFLCVTLISLMARS